MKAAIERWPSHCQAGHSRALLYRSLRGVGCVCQGEGSMAATRRAAFRLAMAGQHSPRLLWEVASPAPRKGDWHRRHTQPNEDLSPPLAAKTLEGVARGQQNNLKPSRSVPLAAPSRLMASRPLRVTAALSSVRFLSRALNFFQKTLGCEAAQWATLSAVKAEALLEKASWARTPNSQSGHFQWKVFTTYGLEQRRLPLTKRNT